jgi:hypothetical protein
MALIGNRLCPQMIVALSIQATIRGLSWGGRVGRHY